MLQARRIYRDDFELLHEGMQRFATYHRWDVIERPSEVKPDEPPDLKLVTLEHLGLERLRQIVDQVETMACETCANRNNPPGDGPCVSCDLTVDGPASNYCAEADEPLPSSVLDDFARSAMEDDDEADDEDTDET